MFYRNLILCLFALIGFTVRVAAQDNSKDLDKVDIYTKYKPALSDAHKVEVQPELSEPETKPLKLEYAFPDLRYKVQPAFTPLLAQSYKAKPGDLPFNNFIKVGFGNYTTPLLNIELHNNRNKNYAYGLSASHLSSQGSPKFKAFMDDQITLKGARFINGNTLSGQLGYTRNAYNYYGYNHSENSFKYDSVKQALNNVSGNLHFDNLGRAKKVKEGFDLDFYRFSTRLQTETGYRLSNKVSGKVGNGELGLGLAFEGFLSGPDTVKYNRNFIDINPSYKMKYKEVDLSLGLLATIFLGSLQTKFYLYPEFKAEYYLVPEKLKAHAGISGNLNKASVRGLYNENPFIADYQPLLNQNNSYKIFAGLKGRLGTGFDYILEFSQQYSYNLPIYLSDTFPLHKFIVQYDDVNLFKFNAGLNYTRFDKLKIGTNFTYFAYNGDAAHAYQRPDFEWITSISGKATDKLGLHARFFVIGSRYARELGAFESEKLPVIADINVSADYQLKKHLYLFLNVNNVTNQTYQRWNNYPVYGLNGVAGATYSF